MLQSEGYDSDQSYRISKRTSHFQLHSARKSPGIILHMYTRTRTHTHTHTHSSCERRPVLLNKHPVRKLMTFVFLQGKIIICLFLTDMNFHSSNRSTQVNYKRNGKSREFNFLQPHHCFSSHSFNYEI
jgi:hypothetical protein